MHIKSASFPTDNGRTSRLSIFYRISNHRNFTNISIMLLQIPLKRHEHWDGYWKKKLLWTILEEQFPKPRKTAASKIGNGVISLRWQLRCHCNSDDNKFSSVFNATEVAIVQNLCLCRRSLCSILGGIDPEKLYLATLTSVEKTTEPKRHMLICPDNLAKVHSFSFNLDLRFHFTVQLLPIVRLYARNRTYFFGKYCS